MVFLQSFNQSQHTVGSKSVAMFGRFGLIVMQHLLEWKSHLAPVR